jgi:cytochrome P450
MIINFNSKAVVQDSFLWKKCAFIFCLEAEVILNKGGLSRMGWSSVLGLLPYGDRFRKHRRLMQQYFHPRVLQNYHPMIELEVAIFVDELDKTPKDFRAHLRR